MWFEAIALGIMAGLGYYVARPLFQELGETADLEKSSAGLEDRKVQVYQALSDLEYDFQLQKICLADYQRLKASLTREALQILADAGNGTAPAGSVGRERSEHERFSPPAGG